MGCDFEELRAMARAAKFQSTQPEWAATEGFAAIADYIDISIHAARVGCDITLAKRGACSIMISIHAARVGCDMMDLYSYVTIVISIHAARVGCDSMVSLSLNFPADFNPRSPSGLRQYKNKL